MLTLARDTIVAGRYRVLGKIGRGGMGVVYVAEHVVTGEKLALKMLVGADESTPFDVPTLERFKREARASARIQSEHVVRVIDADTASDQRGAPFLVMELLEGSDLERLIGTRGKLAPAETVTVLSQAARGLDASHIAGIVHRDLKPSNVFLHRRRDGSSTVKVVDFGLSKIVDEAAIAKATQTGAVMGTPLYMSPEQARGRGAEISPATDVWAVGLIAVHMLTGDVYWKATAIGELVTEIVVEPLYPPSSRWPFLPAAFDAWFFKSCARDPKERFASVGEQVAELAKALEQPTNVSTLPEFEVVTMRPLPEREELEVPLAATAAPPRSPPGPNTPISVGHGTVDHFAATLASTDDSKNGKRSAAASRRMLIALTSLATLVAVAGFAWRLRASATPAPAATIEAPPRPTATATATATATSTSAPVETGAGSAVPLPLPSTSPSAAPPKPRPRPVAAKPSSEPAQTKPTGPFNPIAP